MSFMDNSLAFSTSWTSAQTITASADSTNVVDLTGAGSGNVPALVPAVFGADMGLGDGMAFPYLYVAVTAVNGSPTSNTLTILLEAAPDNGSGGQGAYTVIYTSTAKAENVLVKGDYLLVPVPPTLFEWPSESLPRFYKLHFTCSSALAGLGVVAGLMLNPPSSLILGQYQSNFTVV